MPLPIFDLPAGWRSAMKKVRNVSRSITRRAYHFIDGGVEAMSKSKCRTRETRTTACTRGGMSSARTLVGLRVRA